jgi:hypothetical protein
LGLSVLAADGTWTTYTPANSGLPDASISGIAFDTLFLKENVQTEQVSIQIKAISPK